MNKRIRNFLIVAFILLFSNLFYTVKLHYEKQIMDEELEMVLDQNISLMKVHELKNKKSNADDLLIQGEFDAAFDLYRLLVKEENFKDLLQKREQYIEDYNELRQKANEEMIVVKVDSSAQKSLNNEIANLKNLQVSKIDSLTAIYESKIRKMKAELNNQPRLKELSFYSIHGTKTTYFGEVANDKANGEGMGYYRSGNVYIGTWKNNLKESKSGTYYFLNGDRYEGNYLKDRREGKGTYFWASGDRYEGEWSDDKRNGYGVLYGSDNKVKMKGTWKNDEIVEPVSK